MMQPFPSTDQFVHRHLGPTDADIQEMLATLGLQSLDALTDATVPEEIRMRKAVALDPSMGEHDALAKLRVLHDRNQVFRSFIGMGYYDCITPPVIQRNILENPGWYTQYTPYQAEIAQGRLEALLNYQTVVADLTGLPLANASLLDEGTAAAEAMMMCLRVKGGGKTGFFVAQDCHPQTIAVMQTRAEPFGITVHVGPVESIDVQKQDLFGMLLQYPATDGVIRDDQDVIARAHAAGALVVVATDLLALTLLRPPGEFGADIAIGSSQRFGVPLGFGGPHAAFLSTKDEYKRQMPGRIVGVSKDAAGKPAYRMALQTREQHIRREKATSNICTAQVLLAIIASMFAIYNGPKGIAKMAQRTHRFAEIFAAAVKSFGYDVKTKAFFDTVTIHAPGRAHTLWARAKEKRINLRFVDADHIGIAFDQSTRRQELERLLAVFKTDALERVKIDDVDKGLAEVIPVPLRRTSSFLTHPVFEMYHSETEMLRYLRHLQMKDIALDQSMIALGS